MLFRIRYYIWTDIIYLVRTDVPNWFSNKNPLLSDNSFISRIPGFWRCVPFVYAVKSPPKHELHSQSHMYFMMHKNHIFLKSPDTRGSHGMLCKIFPANSQYLKGELMHNMYIKGKNGVRLFPIRSKQ